MTTGEIQVHAQITQQLADLKERVDIVCDILSMSRGRVNRGLSGQSSELLDHILELLLGEEESQEYDDHRA